MGRQGLDDVSSYANLKARVAKVGTVIYDFHSEVPNLGVCESLSKGCYHFPSLSSGIVCGGSTELLI